MCRLPVWKKLVWIALLTGLPATYGVRLPDGRRPELQAPAGQLPARIDPAAATILPNGRVITPRGTQVKVAPHPYGLALSPDGKTLATSNSGTSPFSASILTDLNSEQPAVAQIPPGSKPSDADPQSVYLGVAVAPDNRTLYLSEGDNGAVGVFDLVTHERKALLSLDGAFQGRTYRHSLSGELKLSADGRYLYVLDMAHFRLVIVDTASQQILTSAPVGRLPFGLALSPNGQWAYVSNAGMFRYSLVPGYDPKNRKQTGLDFPPFGFPSEQARDGVVVQGRKIAGLGDPNAPESNSLWILDVSIPSQTEVRAKIPTGTPVGPHSVGGSSPGAVVAGRKWVFVSNAPQDSVTVIDARTWRVRKTITLEPATSVEGLRGVLPLGMALSPDEAWLYVACAGLNALAVLDAAKGRVVGYIPVGWFPARVEISGDGRTLYVANAKGFGAGPNGGEDFHPGPEGTYIGDITKGTVSIISLPKLLAGPGSTSAPASAPLKIDRRVLQFETGQVLYNNGFISNLLTAHSPEFPVPSPEQLGMPSSKIHHVIFIAKENRTFDQVFGDLARVDSSSLHSQLPGAERLGAQDSSARQQAVQPSPNRVDGDPALAEFGDDATVKPEAKAEPEMGEKVASGQATENLPRVEHARVTPNHHALTERFGISDNFYVDGDVSVDGHHWLVGNYPNEVLETGWPAAYGGKFHFEPDPDAPGRLEIGASGPWPETYLEAGSLWEHLARHGITFRNYGEGVEMAGNDEEAGLEPTGVREAVNMPMPQVLFENTSRSYPTFNTNISDQYRFQQFKQEFETRYAKGPREIAPLPQFLFIWLPDDHTADPRPSDGYPYRASYVADNDLALGKLVELFSHSPFWRDCAIFVTEDDAQDGTDHVDAHRSLLLVISPYSRRGVSHVHTSIASILKTFDLILGLPYLNQYDAAATDLSDCFTDRPDFTPYEALPPDTRIFDPAKVVEAGFKVDDRTQPPPAPLDDPATIRRDLRERRKP